MPLVVISWQKAKPRAGKQHQKKEREKKVAYQQRSALLSAAQALRPQTEPEKLQHGFEPLTFWEMSYETN